MCRACLSGHYNLCAFGASIGLASDGGFAAMARIPSYCAVPLPAGVSSQEGALLEPLAVGLHALDRGQVKAGEVIVVLGFGAIGASTAMVARSIGIHAIISEPHDGRRSRAIELGFQAFNPTGTGREIAKAVRNMTHGGADAVFDCAGVRAALEAAPEMTKRGGNVVVVGLHKQPTELDASRLLLFERGVFGSLGYAHDLPRVATLIDAGLLAPSALVTNIIDLSETPSQFELLASGQTDDIKTLVRPATR